MILLLGDCIPIRVSYFH